MSEYQYYEWRAIDRPLTPEEQAEVNSLSSHIYVDSSRAWVEYHWSSFRHNPQEVLACYFDTFLYWASWGSRQLMFRFSKELLDAEALTPYLVPDHIELEEVEGAYVLVLWLGEIEEWDYPYPEGWDLGVLIALRNDILAGDYRALYLAWLKLAEVDEGFLFPEDRPEPPVPPGLKRLSPTLEALVRFLELDRHLLQVAAQAGEDAPPSQLGREALEDAIRLLPLDERDEFLRRLLRGEPHLSLVLQRRLQSVVGGAPRPGVAPPSRTVEELRLAAEALAEEERRRREEAERARRRRELEALAAREEETWQEVEALIETYKPKAYDEAVRILKDLRDLAEYQDKENTFRQRVAKLADRYRRRSSLTARMRQAGLIEF